MRGDDPRCACSDRRIERYRKALSRGGQACLHSDRGMFANIGRSPEDLHRTQGKNLRSGHDRQVKAEEKVKPESPSDGSDPAVAEYGSPSAQEKCRRRLEARKCRT